MYKGKKIIIGRDKLDMIKGVLHKLAAFETFLMDYPEWQDQVVLVQISSPPIQPVPKLEAKISEAVSRINGAFGSLQFAPIYYYSSHLEEEEYYALLSCADIALITSVRDGMNTTALEYIVCQEKSAGQLILSEFTGTAEVLPMKAIVNPLNHAVIIQKESAGHCFHTDLRQGIAEQINAALKATQDEKQTTQRTLYEYVTTHTSTSWAHSFITELQQTVSSGLSASIVPTLDLHKCINAYKTCKTKRLFFFDYDVNSTI